MSRRTWPLALLVVGPALALVSLYLPWRAASCTTSDAGFIPSPTLQAGLPSLFAGCGAGNVDGWARVGDVSALAALALALATTGALLWPRLRDRLPSFPLGLVVVYFLLAVVAQTRNESDTRAQVWRMTGGAAPIHYHVAYGTYVGVAAAGLVFAGAWLVRPSAPPADRSLRRLSAGACALGLLAALLLPWQRTGWVPRLTELGVADSSGAIAAALAVVVLVTSTRARTRALEAVAVTALLFAAAAFAVDAGGLRTYGAWIGIGFAAAAACVLLTDRSVVRSIRRPTGYAAAAIVAGAALVTSLFLPWQTACYANSTDFRSVGLAGRCVSSNGFGIAGSTAALLTIALVAAASMLPSSSRSLSVLELATGLGLLVATLGFGLESGTRDGVHTDFGFGAFVGFAAAAVLIALAVSPARWRRPDIRSIAPFLVPIALAVAYVAAVVLPWWGVLPEAVWPRFTPGAGLSWLTLAAALVGVRIVFSWVRQAGGADRAPELVLLSLALIALDVLDAVPLPTIQLNRTGGLLLGLSLPLALLAAVEGRGGLRSLEVPEILRVDRI